MHGSPLSITRAGSARARRGVEGGALLGVGGLDQRFEHVESDGLDAVADGERVAFREFLDGRREPRQELVVGPQFNIACEP